MRIIQPFVLPPVRMLVDRLIESRIPGGLGYYWGRCNPRLCFVLRSAFGEPRTRAPRATCNSPPAAGIGNVFVDCMPRSKDCRFQWGMRDPNRQSSDGSFAKRRNRGIASGGLSRHVRWLYWRVGGLSFPEDLVMGLSCSIRVLARQSHPEPAGRRATQTGFVVPIRSPGPANSLRWPLPGRLTRP